MKISVQTAQLLDKLGIEEGFSLIAESGFDCVDFNLDHCLPGNDIRSHRLQGFFDQSDEEILARLEPYRLAAERHGVTFGQAHAPFPSYVKDSPETNDYMRMAIEKTMMMCAKIGCPWLVVHPAYLAYGEHVPADEEYRTNFEFYLRFLPAIRKTGVRIATENMFSRNNGRIMESCMSDVPTACRIVDELNEAAGEDLYGFCYDVGHGALLNRDQYRMITGYGKRITVLHVHDNDAISDEHLFPYDGVVDWNAVCRGLKDIQYKGTLSFETYNGLRTHDIALWPEQMRLLRAIGALFASKIEG